MSVWFRREKLYEPPFRLYTGRRGSGKTLLAACDFLERPAGRDWYANCELVDPRDGYHAGRVYSWEQLAQLENCVVLIDEAPAWAHAYEWDKIPAEVLHRWSQSRKNGIGLVVTVQNVSQLAKPLRVLLDEVVVVRRHPWRNFDPRLPVALVADVESIEYAERLQKKDITEVESFETRVIKRVAYDAYATGETIEMQVLRRDGYEAGVLPIRRPFYHGDGSAAERVFAASMTESPGAA